MSELVGLGWSAARAADELERLRRCRPVEDAPVRVWVPWLERQVELWDVIVATDAAFAGNAQFVADHLRRKIKDLYERFQPGDRWPEAWTW